MTIQKLLDLYGEKIDKVDLELLIAYSLGKTREFVLTYPEQELSGPQEMALRKLLKRRAVGEPVAYIFGHKEFYGLDFLVNKHTLIPRPETELLVDLAINSTQDTNCRRQDMNIIDVGTGSGCIIISVAKTMGEKKKDDTPYRYFATDISKDALEIARKNAEINEIAENITFLHGNLLDPIIGNGKLETCLPKNKIGNSKIVILANLPYLSDEIFESAPIDVRDYEPKTALHSEKSGLAHYEQLLHQLKKILAPHSAPYVSCFFEISPEQKIPLHALVKSFFPKASIAFHKDLAGKWRIAYIKL